MAELKKIKKQNTLKSAVNALREYILANRLRPGDRIPTEHELTEGLGISRNIIREALQYFKALGIIESRPKVGAIIAKLIPENPYKGYLPFIAMDPGAIREAAQMRMVLECGAVHLMTANCADEDIQKLEKLAAKIGNDAQNNLDHEVAFHSELLRMTKNSFIESMIPLTVAFFSEKISDTTKRDTERITREHRRIVEALSERNPEKLNKAFREHYKFYFNQCQKKEHNQCN